MSEDHDQAEPVGVEPDAAQSKAPARPYIPCEEAVAALEKEIEVWFSEFRGGAIARNVAAWNAFAGSIEGLKARLRAVLWRS